MVDVRSIDNNAVRVSQTEKLQKLRADRDEAKVQEALQKLTEAARSPSSTDSGGASSTNLLMLSVEAARLRATLGEITEAMEVVYGRHVAHNQTVQGAYSATFNGSNSKSEDEYANVLQAVEEFDKQEGRRPRILVAKMGQDGHDRGAKVIASGFSDMGYDVDVGPLFSTPDEVARQAIDADAHVVGVSSQAAGHKTLVPALLKALKEQGGGHIKVICGGVIPPQDYDFLYEAGAVAIFGPGTRITEAAVKVLEHIRTAV